MKNLLTILLFFPLFLFAEEMYFDINYLGMTVVKSTFIYENDSLIVTAKSAGVAKILKSMDNRYTAIYSSSDSLFLPNFYKKNIKQKSYREKRTIEYFRYDKTAVLTDFLNPGFSKKYDIYPEIRDFFSTLFFLRKNLKDYLEFDIDANSIFWRGKAKFVSKCKLKVLGKEIEVKKYKITYEKISENSKKENSDMLTNNLVGKGKTLYLWFSTDAKHIPVKAKFFMKPFSVFWYLTEYKQ